MIRLKAFKDKTKEDSYASFVEVPDKPASRLSFEEIAEFQRISAICSYYGVRQNGFDFSPTRDDQKAYRLIKKHKKLPEKLRVRLLTVKSKRPQPVEITAPTDEEVEQLLGIKFGF